MKKAAALALALLAACAQEARAADAQAGKAKAGACTVCHGPLGVSVAPDAPHLAGQPEIYLAAQLRAFKSGRRAHEVMAVIAKGLGEQDIDDLAAWFASLKVTVTPP